LAIYQEKLTLSWLVSMPVISLISLSYGEKTRKDIILLFGGFYIADFVLVFLVYAVRITAKNSHPVVFAILDQIFAILLALLVSVNAIFIYRQFSKIKASKKANSVDAQKLRG